MTGPSRRRFWSASIFACLSSAFLFSVSSHRFKLLLLCLSTRSASARRSACVISFGLRWAFFLAASSMVAINLTRFTSLCLSRSWVSSLLCIVCRREDDRVGPSSTVGIHEMRSDFFFGRGAGSSSGPGPGPEPGLGTATGSILTFLRSV